MTDKKCVICQKVINTGEKFNLEGEEDYTHIECDLVSQQNRYCPHCHEMILV